MTDAPPADFHVDEALAARLVAAQHPDLAGPVRLVANGWDNAMFRLGDRYSVRMPRRLAAVGLMRNEQRWLPELAPRAARGGAGSGAERPPGARARLRRARGASCRGSTARTGSRSIPRRAASPSNALAAFVAELARHACSGGCAGERVPRGAARCTATRPCARGSPAGASPRRRHCLAVWERALAAPAWTGPAVWLHGDLHPANLLLAPSGALVAVIDFGDITAGDPATDLATAWLTFDPRSRRIFRAELEARRGVDEATWDRARGWALLIASAVVEVAGTTGELRQRGVVRAGAGAAGLTRPFLHSAAAGDAMHGCRGVGSAPVPTRARLGSCTTPMRSPRSRVAPWRPSRSTGRADTS